MELKGLDPLELRDDAAYVNWGGLWRIGDRFVELFDYRYTTTVWDENRGGFQITSTLNGKSIFLPDVTYWSGYLSEPYGGADADEGECYWFDHWDEYTGCSFGPVSRAEGLYIRPMCSWKAARVKEIILDVTSLVLTIGGKHQFSVTISPEDVENKSVLWSSSNESVTIVDANGFVTAVGKGTCNITCTTQDGSRKSTSCKIEVYPYHDLSGTIDGYASVDLGLPSGTLWATQNVGASSPEDYGEYFAWGEVESKESYTRDNYKYYDEFDYTRYWHYWATWHDDESPYLHEKWEYDTLSLYDSDDAAFMNWGSSKWYTPTQAQLEELINSNYTSIVLTIQNKVYGYKVTSKLNGNSIFLPAAGKFLGSSISERGTYGYYWSKTLNTPHDYNDICEPFILKLGTDDISVVIGGDPWRITGLSVRPVHSVIRANYISLNQTNIIFNQLGTAELSAIVSPSDADYKELSWSSSNTDVATVSPTGLVTAVADGTCKITCATMDGSGVKATCTVTVELYHPVTGISLDKEAYTLHAIDETVQLTATIQPENATNKNVTWSSSDENVCKVVDGLVTATGEGTAIVTVKTEDGEFTATCVISVEIPHPITGISLDKEAYTLHAIDETVQLTATIQPENATNKNVTWSSSDEGVCTVVDGLVTAKGEGTAIVTVITEDGGFTATCAISVEIPHPVTGISLNYDNYSLKGIGESVQLEATILPENATNKDVTWKSYNENVCIVNKGLVVGVGYGVAVVSVTTADGSYMATCTITVEDNTPVNNIDANNQGFRIFNLQGVGQSQIQKGINIIRFNDGTTKKILVK